MRRALFASVVLILVAVVVVAAQQPAAPPPPAAPPVTPPAAPGESAAPKTAQPPPAGGSPTPSAPRGAPNETLLAKFEPLVAYPSVTQFSVRGVLLGSAWMAKMHQPHGRFVPGYNPALRQPLSGEHDLKQAQCALAMAQAARFAGDAKQTAQASQAILALLAATKADPADANCRVPVHLSLVCNRVGFAGTLSLAIYELPGAGEKLIDDAERLVAFLRTRLRADGSVHYTDGPDDVPAQIDPTGINEYPGCALQAIAVSNRVRPAEWKKEAVKRGVAHYLAAFKAKPHPMLAATVTPAASELYLQTKSAELASAAFEMNDWLCGMQIGLTDQRTPQWAGGFRTVVNGQAANDPPEAAATGALAESLACAYQLTHATGDLARSKKYQAAVTGAAEFLCRLQFLESNTRHFENGYRVNMLIGAFHLSPADGNLRTESTARAVSGLVRFLASGAGN